MGSCFTVFLTQKSSSQYRNNTILEQFLPDHFKHILVTALNLRNSTEKIKKSLFYEMFFPGLFHAKKNEWDVLVCLQKDFCRCQ